MKAEIHPTYEETTITCGCGEVIQTRSTAKDIHIEICSKCHPFYSGGTDRLVDTEGRIGKFHKKFGIADGGTLAAVEAKRKAAKANAAAAEKKAEEEQADQ
jgi:large subunit ribosomal protein L31